ncbi:unnamed protein product [Sphenostylis stenocarpa]|uniref:Protein TIME FOR COFFEE n=1 Tax=Sphenostylis stenocarpa TaxID=92480 RepID=A0AA86VWB4_9FABA|nr:unnamed protein product [Sphenostylis stenocarpa]
MDRNRGRSSSSMSANAFPRRRHPTISLRGASQEVQEMRSKDNNNNKREWTKKRRGSNSHSTEEESVGNEPEARLHSNNTASSASDHNHQGRNVIDQVMIGATVPRRTRSASVKRPHHSWVEEQSAEAASPSSSNVSLPKKMKAVGPSSSNQEDIEIEIAELLYGLRTSQNHDYSSSQKVEASDSPPLSSYPSVDVGKKKVGDYRSSFTLPPNKSIAESVGIDSEQHEKTEKPSSESPRMSCGHGIGTSQGPKQDTEEDSLNSGCGFGETVDGKSESKLDVHKQDCASNVGIPEGNDQHKFEIDLMAPPPAALSPEWDNLSRGEDSNKVEDKVESFNKKEKALEKTEELKMKVDLEKPDKHNNLATEHELGELGRNKEQPTTTSTNPKLEKSAQCSSMSLSVAVSERPSSFSPLGYMPLMGTVVKTDKTTGLLTAPQHEHFVLSQPWPQRCATHGYIARNIFMHQQWTKMNTLLPSAVGCGSMCDTKLNRVQSAESVVVGKQFHKQSPPGVSQNAAPDKGWSITSDFSLAAFKSSGPANPMDMTQMKQLMLQQGPHPGSSANIVHGPAFPIPPSQHQASVLTNTSQVGGVNNSSSSSLSNKFHGSAAGSLGASTLPAVAAAMSFSYPNLAANDAPYMTIVPNSGYPFPFANPLGPSAAIRNASPAQSTPILNGPLYSSQIFHPLQYPQQHPHSQPLVQPSYLNASTSSVSSSSSHKQSQGMQGNNNHILSSTTMQLQQSQKQHTSQSHLRKHETGMAGENAPSAAIVTAYSQKNVFGQNFPIPVQPLSLSLTPSTTSDSVGGYSGNFGDKQQQTLKGGLDHIPSQPYAISFSAYNGASAPSNLNFSTMAQNPVIFQSLSDIAWQGYHAASTSHATQQKMYPIIEGKSGDSSSHQEDEKKATSGKPSTNGPTTLVFDNSSKNHNLVSSPMNGNWPSRSITSTGTTTGLPLSSNPAKSQQPSQLLHLPQQHGLLQQQPAVATRYKAPSTNATIGAKFFTPLAYSQTQTQTQSKSSIQGTQSKMLVTALDSQVHNPCIVTSTPTLQSFSQDQGRVLQGHTQISYGGNYISSLPLQGQQLFNNNQSLSTTVAGIPPTGANLKTNSQGSKVSSSVNSSQMQPTENSSTANGQKSSPVCGRNVPSILSSCPSHLSELKY